MDRRNVITANRADVGFLPSRTLVITLLLSLLLLLSACQLPFIASDTEDAIEEVETPTTGEEGAAEGTEEAAAEEGQSSIFGEATPATGTAEESADAADATPESEESSAAADADENVEETEASAEDEGAEEGTDAAAEDEGADAEASAEDEGADAEAAAEDADADAEASAEDEGADAEASAEDEGADAEASAEDEGADAEASAEGEAASTAEESADGTTATEGEGSATDAGAESSAAEASDGAAEAASSASSTPQVQITADSVEVHDGPGPYNPVVGSLAKDNTVDVIGRNLGATWYYVKVSDTLDGWVPAESAQGVGDFSANELPVLKAPAIPAPTAMPEPTSTGGGSEGAPTATPTTTESAPTATPIAQSGAFTYGIQAHLVHIDRRLPFANTTGLGFGLIKQQIEWKEWEKTEGDINWSEMDAIVQEAQENNLQVLYSVVGAPDWAREAGFDDSVAGPPADPATFASFVSQMATRYCGQNLRAIEVWNEQNLHYEWGNQTLDPAAYMALLKPSYEAIKAACPSMTVVSGALTPAGDIGTLAIDDFTYLQGMFDNGLANVADVIGAHPSGYNVPPSLRYTEACAYLEQKTPAPTFKGPCDTPHHSWSFLSTLEGYQNIIQQNSSTQKIWATEFGWAAGGSFAAGYEYADDNSLDEQAEWSVEAFEYMRDSGYVEAAILWNLNFRMIADGTEKAQWGIVANNSQPLPAFIALQAMPK